MDPQGDLNKKPRSEHRMDWWVEDKKSDWRPNTYADTKRGRKASRELGGTKTMEQRPLFTQKPEEKDDSVFVQPQHRNTGHASVRLGGPEDGKVTMLGSGAEPKEPAAKPHPQPVGGLARAEAKTTSGNHNPRQPVAWGGYKPPRMRQPGEAFHDPNIDHNITNLWKEIKDGKAINHQPTPLESHIIDTVAQVTAEQLAAEKLPSTLVRALKRTNFAYSVLGDLLSPSVAHAPTLSGWKEEMKKNE